MSAAAAPPLPLGRPPVCSHVCSQVCSHVPLGLHLERHLHQRGDGPAQRRQQGYHVQGKQTVQGERRRLRVRKYVSK